jgi:hypothetical protein
MAVGVADGVAVGVAAGATSEHAPRDAATRATKIERTATFSDVIWSR